MKWVSELGHSRRKKVWASGQISSEQNCSSLLHWKKIGGPGVWVRPGPWCVPVRVFQARRTGRGNGVRAKTRWRDYIFHLVWELWVPHEALGSGVRKKGIWACLLRRVPQGPGPGQVIERGWMDGWIDRSVCAPWDWQDWTDHVKKRERQNLDSAFSIICRRKRCNFRLKCTVVRREKVVLFFFLITWICERPALTPVEAAVMIFVYTLVLIIYSTWKRWVCLVLQQKYILSRSFSVKIASL